MARSDEPRFYVNTFAPLIATAKGRKNAEREGLPPFIDGSIRREPDLEHRYPSISCLCRANKFAPRLIVGDVVAYITKKNSYCQKKKHWRLIALLKVEKLFESHAEAAKWYRTKGLHLPSNCMVTGNKPEPPSHSHGDHKRKSACSPSALCNVWDSSYRQRAKDYPRFVVCRPLYRELGCCAPFLYEEDMHAIFGKIPATRNPEALPMKYRDRLVRHCKIRLQRSAV